MKDTVIRIDHDTMMATITVRQARYIKKYMRLAMENQEWKQVSLKADKRGKITSVSYSFPVKRLGIRKPLSSENLERIRASAAHARRHVGMKLEEETH